MKRILNDLDNIQHIRVLKHQEGGFVVTIRYFNYTEIPPIYTHIKNWPEEGPAPKGLNEMWMNGEKSDKILMIEMLSTL